jgi:hypothetical protein
MTKTEFWFCCVCLMGVLDDFFKEHKDIRNFVASFSKY